jgi:hypothetical protein
VTLVKTIEKQIGDSIENVMDDNFVHEEILTISFSKMLLSKSNTAEKRYIALLTQSISKQGTGKLKIKEIVDFLKGIPGKYNKMDVLEEMGE